MAAKLRGKRKLSPHNASQGLSICHIPKPAQFLFASIFKSKVACIIVNMEFLKEI
jgi:hypothetical protein